MSGAVDAIEGLLQEFPDGATVESIVGRVADITGRSIQVDPLGDRDWETVTGLVLIQQKSARILIRKSDPRWYQLHVVLHELAHLLYGHTGCATLPTQFDDLRRRDAVILARGASTPTAAHDERESEAETLAERLSEIVLTPRFEADEKIFG